ADYKSFKDLGEQYPEARVQLTIQSSSLSLRDVLYFNPYLMDSLSLKTPRNLVLSVNAAMEVQVKDLTVGRLQLHALENTTIFANGKIKGRSEEHTSELQSRENLVCRLLLEKK